MENFGTIIAISADSVDQLRKCDVYRVVSASSDCGCMTAFTQWLAGKRPEFVEEIEDCRIEIAAESAA